MQESTQVPQVAPEAAFAAVQAGQAILVDVREDDELEAARIPGALHLPLSQFRARWSEIPRDRPVIVSCASGGRSQVAARVLRGEGYDARNLVHGIVGWHRAGLPIE